MSDVEAACAVPEDFTEPVVIYTTRWCGYCLMALRLLRARNIPFAQVPVDGDAAARRWLSERSGRTTVPQVFIRGASIGGYDELSELDDGGTSGSRLAALLAGAEPTRDGPH